MPESALSLRLWPITSSQAKGHMERVGVLAKVSVHSNCPRNVILICLFRCTKWSSSSSLLIIRSEYSKLQISSTHPDRRTPNIFRVTLGDIENTLSPIHWLLPLYTIFNDPWLFETSTQIVNLYVYLTRCPLMPSLPPSLMLPCPYAKSCIYQMRTELLSASVAAFANPPIRYVFPPDLPSPPPAKLPPSSWRILTFRPLLPPLYCRC